MVTASFLGMTISAPFLAVGLQRLGARNFVAMGYAILVLCLLSLSLVPASVALFAGICLLAGLGASITSPGGLFMIIAGSFDKRLGLAIASSMTGMGLGAFCVPLLSGVLMEQIGWRATYSCLAAVAAVCGTCSLVLMSRAIDLKKVRAAEHGAPLAGGDDSYSAIFKDWRFWVLGLSIVAATLAATGSSAHLPAALSDRGLTQQEAAFGASLIGIGIMVGRLGAAVLMDRIFAPLVVFIAFCLGVTGLQIILHVGVDFKWLLYTGMFMIGVITGSEGDIAPILSKRYFGPGSYRRVMGLLFGFWGVGGVLGPWLAGVSYDIMGDYRSILNGAAVIVFVSGAMLLLLGKYRYAPSKGKPA